MMLKEVFKTYRINILTLLLLFLGCELFISPTGNFSLNDDWSYAYSVSHLNDTGSIDLGYWPAMNLLAHILWGEVFVHFFGFSHFVLRCSTLCLSALTVLIFYQLLFHLFKNHYKAFIASLFLLFNPVFFLLSNTFMTDVPFLLSVVLSFYCAEKILVQKKQFYIVVFSAVCMYSILIRQFGLALPLSFFAASVLFLYKEKNKWKALIICLLPLVISAITFVVFEKWAMHLFPPGSTYEASSAVSKNGQQLMTLFLENIPIRFSETMLYMGLFLSPFLVLTAIKYINRSYLKDYLFITPVCIIICFFSMHEISKFPIGNILYTCGLGTETLYDTAVLNINASHSNSDLFSIIIKTLAILGSMSLSFITSFTVLNLTRGFKNKQPVNSFKVFLVFFSVIYFMLLCISKSFFDRYTLPLFAALFILMADHVSSSKINTTILMLCLLTSSCFTVLATNDYFNWNRARWKIIDTTVKQGVNPKDINGGLEYIAGTFYTEPWWGLWTGELPYIVTFGPVKNYKKINYITYQRYIPLKRDTLFIYHK